MLSWLNDIIAHPPPIEVVERWAAIIAAALAAFLTAWKARSVGRRTRVEVEDDDINTGHVVDRQTDLLHAIHREVSVIRAILQRDYQEK